MDEKPTFLSVGMQAEVNSTGAEAKTNHKPASRHAQLAAAVDALVDAPPPHPALPQHPVLPTLGIDLRLTGYRLRALRVVSTSGGEGYSLFTFHAQPGRTKRSRKQRLRLAALILLWISCWLVVAVTLPILEDRDLAPFLAIVHGALLPQVAMLVVELVIILVVMATTMGAMLLSCFARHSRDREE
ncbi:hypothetical protein CspeluHIS016_0701310 [Cutaneotrichosporon spelunceum]|uniref:Uncharacterized protein n=1 Tax=Cutaneotrichosporon spelunceum TaxID=1672016 RepID=A0AAD3TYY2_9TREE|nr:hypothetical protein CspeluHIS016_0701310 [Cutaneotrichosporon spelunceum]